MDIVFGLLGVFWVIVVPATIVYLLVDSKRRWGTWWPGPFL